MIATVQQEGDAEEARPVTDEEIEETLRDVRALLNDPAALIERALMLMRRKANDLATWLFFGALAGSVLLDDGPLGFAADLVT